MYEHNCNQRASMEHCNKKFREEHDRIRGIVLIIVVIYGHICQNCDNIYNPRLFVMSTTDVALCNIRIKNGDYWPHTCIYI